MQSLGDDSALGILGAIDTVSQFLPLKRGQKTLVPGPALCLLQNPVYSLEPKDCPELHLLTVQRCEQTQPKTPAGSTED